ncbi:MAG: hypothetical protein SF123_10340, partial [Chloroflexota bacterium]|nr:hypothetical protein [Chloroflexota bacterium]
QAREQKLERRSQTFLRSLVGVLLLATLGAFGLTAFALDREAQAQTARDEAVAAFRNAERQRLALRADQVLDAGANGNIGFALAMRSLQYGYNPEADIALQRSLADGIPLRSLPPVRNGVYSMFYSHEGTLIALPGEAVVRVVDVATGNEIQTLTGDEVYRYAEFSHDDQLLVVLGDNTLRILDTETWEQLHHIDILGNVFGYLTPNMPDHLFIHFSTDSILELNIRTGEQIRRHPLTTARGESVDLITYDPDGNLRYLVKDAQNRLMLFNPETETIACPLIDTPSDAFTWTAQPTRSGGEDILFTAQGSRSYIFDFSCQQISQFAGHEPGVEIWNIDILPEHDFIATGDSSSQVILWSLRTGVEIARFSPTDFRDLAISPDSRQIAIGDFETTYIWDLTPLEDVRQIVINSISPFPQFAADGQSVYVGGFGNPFGHWSLDGRNLSPNFDFEWQIRGFDVSADGRMMAVSVEEGRAGNFSNYLLNPDTGEILHELVGHAELVNYISFSPDETQVLSGGFDTTAQIWDVASGERLRVYEGVHTSAIGAFYSPDGQRILTISIDSKAAIWDVVTGEVMLVVEHGGAALAHGSFAPDGESFATASTEGFATIWDAETGEMRLRLAHPNVVFATHFSPDGRFLLTACWDGMVRLWDVATGELVRLWDTGHGEISSAEFSPDGQYIVAANGGTNTELRQPFVQVWRVNLDAVIAAYCARNPLDLTPEERTQYGITDNDPICPPP